MKHFKTYMQYINESTHISDIEIDNLLELMGIETFSWDSISGDILKSQGVKVTTGSVTYDGNIMLDGSDIEHLPDNLTITGELDLYGSSIKELPRNLIVGDSLHIDDTEITEIPDTLVVGGNLYLGNKAALAIPKGAEIKGQIYSDL